jgi:hypothetical protein
MLKPILIGPISPEKLSTPVLGIGVAFLRSDKRAKSIQML